MRAADTRPVIYTGMQVQRKFGVCAKTVWRWARDGKITFFETPGGRRRYYAVEIDRLAAERTS
jgi:predicted site-specific integrase-resolvase